MKYKNTRPLTDHIGDVVAIFFDLYQSKHKFSKEEVEGLQETLAITIKEYYKNIGRVHDGGKKDH